MAFGKLEVVGVAGRTLTLLCGLALKRMLEPAVGEATEVVVEDVDEAFEWET